MAITVRIITPSQIFLSEQAEELILPTSTGQIGVLTGHAALITALDIGPRVVRKKSGWTGIALIGGFAIVQENQVIILVSDAVDAASIEKSKAEKELEEVTNRINQVTSDKDKLEAIFAFKRARARYQVVLWGK